ncbi:MAG: 2-isopropylmalate synthase [Deltaproteobacteria bacterium]|nr:2-isopropylmalate synthase [Deltaproteobacteria bacterium]
MSASTEKSPPSTVDSAIKVFDTTLRDGEQSPGASLTGDEKLEIARQLRRLKVDIIEAGFPAASPGDLEAVQRIAEEVGGPGGPVIAGLARAHRGDIDQAWQAVRAAERPRIHTFLATSELHMARKLQMTPAQVVERVAEMVAYARSLCDDVEFSPEDASRSEPEFLIEVLAKAIEAGATTLNIPDTVGYGMPADYGALMARLIAETPGGGDVTWSVHCHDDLGMATANTLAGLAAGARQAEVTINGIGERAGNTSLEEVVMALATRRDSWGLGCGIDPAQLVRSSRLVESFTGLKVPANKAIVGANAFAHEAGIHQDGMLKDRRTYEIMTPADVGWDDTQLVLGKHSGRHAFQVRLRQLGFELQDEELAETFRRFKELADRKKTLTDADLLALLHEQVEGPEEIYRLCDLQVTCGRPGMPTATVRLQSADGEEAVAAEVGTGPVEAAFGAIDRIVAEPCRLLDYFVDSVTPGLDALGGVTVRIAPKGEPDSTFSGFGVDADVVVASTQAYLAAVNRMLGQRGLAVGSGVGNPAVGEIPLASPTGGGASEVPGGSQA